MLSQRSVIFQGCEEKTRGKTVAVVGGGGGGSTDTIIIIIIIVVAVVLSSPCDFSFRSYYACYHRQNHLTSEMMQVEKKKRMENMKMSSKNKSRLLNSRKFR